MSAMSTPTAAPADSLDRPDGDALAHDPGEELDAVELHRWETEGGRPLEE